MLRMTKRYNIMSRITSLSCSILKPCFRNIFQYCDTTKSIHSQPCNMKHREITQELCIEFYYKEKTIHKVEIHHSQPQ